MCAQNKGILVVVLILLTLIIPSVAHANAGFPMFLMTVPAMGIFFLPVVGIESLVICRQLKIDFRNSFYASPKMNLVSCVLGTLLVPVVGMCMAYIVWNMIPPLAGISTDQLPTNVDTIISAMFQSTFYFEPAKVIKLENGQLITESYPDWFFGAVVMFALLFYFLASWLIERAYLNRRFSKLSKASINVAVLTANSISYGLLALPPAWMLVKNIFD